MPARTHIENKILRERIFDEHLQKVWNVSRASGGGVHCTGVGWTSVSSRAGCYTSGYQRRSKSFKLVRGVLHYAHHRYCAEYPDDKEWASEAGRSACWCLRYRIVPHLTYVSDFGIASKVDASNKAVVGSPYWSTSLDIMPRRIACIHHDLDSGAGSHRIGGSNNSFRYLVGDQLMIPFFAVLMSL